MAPGAAVNKRQRKKRDLKYISLDMRKSFVLDEKDMYRYSDFDTLETRFRVVIDPRLNTGEWYLRR